MRNFSIGIKAVKSQPNLGNDRAIGKAFGDNGKIINNHKSIFADPQLWMICEENRELLTSFYKAKYRCNLIDMLKNSINQIKGSRNEIIKQIDQQWFVSIESEDKYLSILNKFENLYSNLLSNSIDRFLFFFEVMYFWNTNNNIIKKSLQREEYKKFKDKIDKDLSLLDSTWKRIRSTESNNRLIVKYPHADEISNGQRDILTFVIELLKFKSSMRRGKKYLLIIDEVFDYLDDANTIAAQYFLSSLLEDNKDNLYLCLLTHLSPQTFRSYIFSDRKINHLYLNKSLAVATNSMMTFIAFREGLDKNKQEQCDLYNKLSCYLFHYNPIKVDYSLDLAKYNIKGLRQTWGKTEVLHKVLIDEINKYLLGQENYDPYGVAMAIRLRIEKRVYSLLSASMQQEFIKIHKTKDKFSYAESKNIPIPEVYNCFDPKNTEQV